MNLLLYQQIRSCIVLTDHSINRRKKTIAFQVAVREFLHDIIVSKPIKVNKNLNEVYNGVIKQ